MCGKETGGNNLPGICQKCMQVHYAVDENEQVVTKEELDRARRRARLEQTTADNIGKE